MAWIELHDNLPDHPKVIEAAGLLKMDKDLLVGKLIRLWTWAINNREDGTFSCGDYETIAETMRFKGKAQRLVDALVQARLLDEMPGGDLVIHDWDERVGMLRAKRETQRAQSRERVKRFRDKNCNANSTQCNALHERYSNADVTQGNAVTVPKPYLIDEEEDSKEEQEVRARVREVFERQIGRKPTGAEADALDWLSEAHDPDLVSRAVEYAGVYAAAAPVPYLRSTLMSWANKGIATEGDLDYHEALRDMGKEEAL